MLLNKKEWIVTGKLALIPVYLLLLYAASWVLTETYSVFDYGRF